MAEGADSDTDGGCMKPIPQVSISRCVSMESDFCLLFTESWWKDQERDGRMQHYNTKCDIIMSLFK